MFSLHFFRALVSSLRALSQNKLRFWLFLFLKHNAKQQMHLKCIHSYIAQRPINIYSTQIRMRKVQVNTLHLNFTYQLIYRFILGDPGAASRDDGIFMGESLQQEQESPWALTLTERVPEAFEIPPSDWPEKYFSGQSAKRNSRATLMSSYTRLFSSSNAVYE